MSIKNLVHINNKTFREPREPVPFDVTKPYTDKAFQSWSRYKNDDFNEKYCHFSGEPSEGKTTMAKPILGKHWKAAKKEFNL